MSILTNPIFWIIVGVIIVLLALIGYLAEGTELANKALGKKSDSAINPVDAVPEMSLNNAVNQINTPNAWTDDVKKDEEDKQETIHTVASVDDWSSMPTGDDLPNNQEEGTLNLDGSPEPSTPIETPSEPSIEVPEILNNTVGVTPENINSDAATASEDVVLNLDGSESLDLNKTSVNEQESGTAVIPEVKLENPNEASSSGPELVSELLQVDSLPDVNAETISSKKEETLDVPVASESVNSSNDVWK